MKNCIPLLLLFHFKNIPWLSLSADRYIELDLSILPQLVSLNINRCLFDTTIIAEHSLLQSLGLYSVTGLNRCQCCFNDFGMLRSLESVHVSECRILLKSDETDSLACLKTYSGHPMYLLNSRLDTLKRLNRLTFEGVNSLCKFAQEFELASLTELNLASSPFSLDVFASFVKTFMLATLVFFLSSGHVNLDSTPVFSSVKNLEIIGTNFKNFSLLFSKLPNGEYSILNGMCNIHDCSRFHSCPNLRLLYIDTALFYLETLDELTELR
ncbi:hypothetical protein RCL1_005994 [Eukaryota sp. TZLM3-RCL]